jgi:hypothetical protein
LSGKLDEIAVLILCYVYGAMFISIKIYQADEVAKIK